MLKKIYILFLFLFSFLLESLEKYDYPGGVFLGDSGNWIEKKDTGQVSKWIESGRDKDWITVFNPKSEAIYMLPIQGGQAFQSIDSSKRKWKPVFLIKNLSSSPQAPKPIKKQTTDSLQIDLPEKKGLPTEDWTGCLSEQEAWLSRKVLEYRASQNLRSIPISRSLSHVAKIHAKDLTANPPAPDCTLQSWSSSPKWTGCCYTKDHTNASCMLDKPRELTDYKSDGYEMVYVSPDGMPTSVEKVLEKWKTGFGFERVISNKKDWDKEEWRAMGIAVFGKYAILWLGTERDPKPIPGICEK
jgi:hypothetical protein